MSIDLLCFCCSFYFLCLFCTGTGGPTVVTEGKDALLTCVITGSFMNDTVLWRRGNNEILAAGTNRVTTDRRFRVLHDESMCDFRCFFNQNTEFYLGDF